MLGREAPLDFFRRSGIPIRGEWTRRDVRRPSSAFFSLLHLPLQLEGGRRRQPVLPEHGLFPYNVQRLEAGIPATFAGTLAISLARARLLLLARLQPVHPPLRNPPDPACGRPRTSRRRPSTLTAIQLVPLFLLPYHRPAVARPQRRLRLPVSERRSPTTSSPPPTTATGGSTGAPSASSWPGRSSSGTSSPPRRCVVARHRIHPDVRPHSPDHPALGQGGLLRLDLLVRCAGRDDGRHAAPEDAARPDLEPGEHDGPGDPRRGLPSLLRPGHLLVWPTRVGTPPAKFYEGLLSNWSVLGVQLDYYHVVDIFLAGIIGVGLYFWFSGRVWCRFACPLAALMHVYTRFSRFRIFPESRSASPATSARRSATRESTS